MTVSISGAHVLLDDVGAALAAPLAKAGRLARMTLLATAWSSSSAWLSRSSGTSPMPAATAPVTLPLRRRLPLTSHAARTSPPSPRPSTKVANVPGAEVLREPAGPAPGIRDPAVNHLRLEQR